MSSDAQSKAEQVKETASKIVTDWFDLLRTARDQTEHFVRERPLTSTAVAFAAGCLLGALVKRR